MKVLKITLFSALAIFLITNLPAQQITSYKFDFGTGKAEKGVTKVAPDAVYSKAKGFGFDFNTGQNIKATENGVTSSKPFYFSIYLPEGNYNVKIILLNFLFIE